MTMMSEAEEKRFYEWWGEAAGWMKDEMFYCRIIRDAIEVGPGVVWQCWKREKVMSKELAMKVVEKSGYQWKLVIEAMI